MQPCSLKNQQQFASLFATLICFKWPTAGIDF